jgi:hypothetical protein
MGNITVGRYTETPELRALAQEHGAALVSDHWQGWIEPDDKSWIAFIDVAGKPTFYLNRDGDGGVIDAAA